MRDWSRCRKPVRRSPPRLCRDTSRSRASRAATGILLAAYADRLVVADPATQEVWTVHFADDEIFMDLKVDDEAAVLTLRCGTGDENVCHLEVPLTDNLWELRHQAEE